MLSVGTASPVNTCFPFFEQYDKKWESDRGFVFYDFNDLETLPAHLHGTFDLVVVDPPFIVREVWEKYAAAVKLLIKTGPACEDGNSSIYLYALPLFEFLMECIQFPPQDPQLARLFSPRSSRTRSY